MKPTHEITAPPRIYVASLSDYNAGVLHGAWIDADQTPAEIQDEIDAMLNASKDPGADEWAIHDHEGFGPLNFSEYEVLRKVSEWAHAIAEHGEAFAAYADYVGTDYATVEGFGDEYAGTWDSEEDFAQDLAEQLGAMPDDLQWPLNCIDWERAARDLFIDSYWSTGAPGGAVYVFSR